MNRIQQPPVREMTGLFAEEEKFQFEKYWRIIKPKLHLVIFITFILVVGAFVRLSTRVTMYQTSGLLMIEPEQNVVSMDRFSFQDYRNEYFNTQIRILRSRTLMQGVRDELNIGGGSTAGGFRIEPIESTRLVQVSYRSPDPEMAANMVNTLFEKFVSFNLDIKTRSSLQASEFITKQIQTLQHNLSEKERELQKYGNRKELFYLSNKDQSTVVEKFADLNKAYTQAQINRINKESIFKELEGLSYENYPQVKRNQLVNNLKSNYSQLEGDYRKKAEIFKESYPEMEQLRSQMSSLQDRIQKETRDIAAKTYREAQGEYQSALKEEKGLMDLMNQQKGVVLNSKTDAIYYNSLDIEVRNMRTLLNHMVKKQKESLMSSRLEGLQTSNIKIIDSAEIPRSPISSGKVKTLMMAFFLGLAISVGFILFLDFLDRTIKEPEQVRTLMGVPALGIIPSPGAKKNPYSYYQSYGKTPNKGGPAKREDVKKIELINFIDPECPLSESYRTIRTSILLSTPKEPPRIMAVTSAVPSEGKTSTTANLGVSFSQLGKRVLIIDGDLRKPRMHKIFNVKNTVGLSSFLVGGTTIKDVIQKTHIPNLFIIPSGPIPPNPVELMDSDHMKNMLDKLTEKVDVIFIDTPPLIGIVDAVVLGKHTDGIILVAWGGKTNQNHVIKAKEELDHYNIRVLGVVLNRLDFKKEHYYYKKYTYQYRYRDDQD